MSYNWVQLEDSGLDKEDAYVELVDKPQELVKIDLEKRVK